MLQIVVTNLIQRKIKFKAVKKCLNQNQNNHNISFMGEEGGDLFDNKICDILGPIWLA